MSATGDPMSEDHAAPILILCPPGEHYEWLTDLAGRRVTGLEHPFVLPADGGDPQEIVRRARAERGGVPLGIVVRDEAAALRALEAGADEAITQQHLDTSAAFGFIDRLALRARLRREQEQMRDFYVHSEKLAALGTLVAGVAHEVNNPLTSLLLSVEGLKLRVRPVHSALERLDELLTRQSQVSRDDLVEVLRIARTGAPITETIELLQEVDASAQTIARVVRDLKLFSRPDDETVPEVLDVRALIDQVLRIVGRQIRAYGSIEIDYEADLPTVVAPAARLAQVFTNILLNAVQAISEVSRPSHRIRISARSDEEAVAVCISDTGPGIPPEVLGRIFDPFFTTKRPGVGTGLGLSISRSLLRRCGGDLLVESVHGDGATFIALIPRPTRSDLYQAYRRPSSLAPPSSGIRSHQRILVVDEDEHVLRAFARTLDTQYDVLLARDSDEAIALLESGSDVDLVVLDVGPPEAPGLAFYRWLEQERPAMARQVVLLSVEDGGTPPLGDSGLPVLRKPVSRAALLNAVQGALGEVMTKTAAK